jgi:hypothetical protein
MARRESAATTMRGVWTSDISRSAREGPGHYVEQSYTNRSSADQDLGAIVGSDRTPGWHLSNCLVMGERPSERLGIDVPRGLASPQAWGNHAAN